MAHKSFNVLVIEDLAIAQIAAHHLFKKLNCNVHIVTYATRALEQLFRVNYDIIFIDIQLPDINGFELAKTIRNTEKRWHHHSLIAVTANSNEDLETNVNGAGFDDYIIKPMTIENIRYILLKHINKSKLKFIDTNVA